VRSSREYQVSQAFFNLESVMQSLVLVSGHVKIHGIFHVEQVLQFVKEGFFISLVKQLLLNHKNDHGQKNVQYTGICAKLSFL
jgi:hypothetical protein